MVNKANDSGRNIVELVELLNKMQNSNPTYPEWAKYDTATTMSDNNGGVIKF
ncbi:hypothetical protein IKF02_00475 [Candidatus Saccharibacteria bacterium]|nr:hypothetical protein [Candidatus Saccharibacteria bacterium]